ncbi:phage baseplate protein [Tatumella saanichensis]|uniref:phage baseplate protein n=1 Tax=Tatumella saanichensis TaxID=480813 RepID=UPI0004B8EEF2|nr:hypothetical protein [Tatumella saanichensis]
MHKIGDLTDTADANGEFTDGNVAGNVQPTELMGQWFTTVQRELLAVMAAANIETDLNDDAQIVTAIKQMITSASTSVNSIYPVGIVMFFAQSRNPNELFPGTNWEYIGENKTIRLGLQDGTDVMTTGGRDQLVLSRGNLPAESLAFGGSTEVTELGNRTTDEQGEHTHGWGRGMQKSGGSDQPVAFNEGSDFGTTSPAGDHRHNIELGGHAHDFSGRTENLGNNDAVDITNTFIRLLGWYRTA